MELAIVIAVVVIALVFDYTNGFHDAANAIATSVSTRALTPRVALGMAAVMNFVGAFLGQSRPDGQRGDLRRDGSQAWSSSWPVWSAPSPGTSPPGTTACRRRPRTP